MELKTAEKAGFCFGVKRAVEMVEKALSGKEAVHALGPVIHNPQVVARLRDRGLRDVERLEDVTAGIVVIRSHGAPLGTCAAIEKMGLSAVDATCPFVKKMHRMARGLMDEGYQLIIVGDRNHSEITSLTSDPGFSGTVVSGPEELDGVKLTRRIGLISQTTQSPETLGEVVDRLLPAAGELKIMNTICDSTVTRQAETRQLAAEVDVMVVIGGRNSANTRRLVEICREAGARTCWVETADEIEAPVFEGVRRTGITAGASTPDWIIEEVAARIMELAKNTVEASPSRQGGISIHRR